MKVKRINISFSLIVCLFFVYFLTGCNSKENQEEIGREILNDFFDSSYEYTTTLYTEDENSEKTVNSVYKGTLVNNPYQQHEVLEEDPFNNTNLVESYSYDENGVIYYAMKLKSGQEEIWLPPSENTRQDQTYNRDDLTFTLDDAQTDSTNQIVFLSNYEDVLEYGESESIEVPFSVSLEFVVDLEKEEVVQITIDNGDSARAVAVARAIENGSTQNEAEDSVTEGTDYINSGIIIDILEYTSDSPIDNPME